MPDQVIINIINNTDENSENGYIQYYSPSLDYMRQIFSIEELSQSVTDMPFFMNNTLTLDPIEFLDTTPNQSPTGRSAYPLTVTIDPGYSFGDGRHATTWLCIKYLLEHLSELSQDNHSALTLLDSGTGTGVLSIIAAKLGIVDIDAIDIYHHAIQCAFNNCSINSCEWIRLHKSDIGDFNPGRQYDIITANLVTDVIIANLRTLVSLTTTGGIIIASGVSSGNNETVQYHFRNKGLRLIDCTHRDCWYGYLLQRVI